MGTKGKKPVDENGNFCPQENHLRALVVFQAHEYMGKLHELMTEAGLSKQTYHYWFRDVPGFPEWWRAQADDWFAKQIIRVQAALLQAAVIPTKRSERRIDTKAAELLLQRFDLGFAPRSKQTVETDVRVSLDAEKTLEAIDSIIKGTPKPMDVTAQNQLPTPEETTQADFPSIPSTQTDEDCAEATISGEVEQCTASQQEDISDGTGQ